MTEIGTSKLAVLLRTRRAELGLSLSEVARRTAIDKGLLSLTERDRNPRIGGDKLKALAQALELPAADLFTAAELIPPAELPTLRPYMRAKYADLPAAAVDEVERFVADLQRRHGPGPRNNEDEQQREEEP